MFLNYLVQHSGVLPKTFSNFVINNGINGYFYHPECWEKKEIFYKKHSHPKVLKSEVKENKVTVFLEDKREISLPINELIKKWDKPDLTAEQLKEYEIFPDRFTLTFPVADIHTDVLTFTGNYCGCC